MWLILGLAAIAMIIQGFAVHAESSMHQIYSAIYITGGCILLGVATLIFQAAEAVGMARERFRLEAPDAYAVAQQERAKSAKTISIALVLLVVILIVIYKFSR